jgi:ATP-dependent helicase/nuclease subunit A
MAKSESPKRRTLSDEQRRAVSYRDSACVLSSGAGCGKTTVLSSRFLSLLSTNEGDEKLSIPHIVAITFTERAAREMRKRIREESGLELQFAADEPVRQQWQRHRQHLDHASIQTIHAFCSTLLRQCPTEAGLDPDFIVLDEASALALRANTVREHLQELVVGDGERTTDLHELIVLSGWQSVLTAIEQLLTEPDEVAWQSFLDRTASNLATEWLGPQRERLLPQWLHYLRSANPAIAGCFAAMDRVDPPTDQCANTFDLIRNEFDRLGQSRDLAADVEALCERAKVKSIGTKKQWPIEADYERVKDAFSEFREAMKSRLTAFLDEGGEPVVRAAEVAQRYLRVALTANEAYRREKLQRAAVDFYDQIALAQTLLRTHQSIREELQNRYRAIMVDEFQDTDPMQMEVVRLLCGEGDWPRKLFVVGDEKQSIYRFRGADVGLFRDLRSAVPEAGRLSLATNYRSRPGVLRFVNSLFARRLSGYEPLVPKRTESGRSADVEFLWSVTEENEEKESADAGRTREADAIARRILSLIRDGGIVVPEQKGKPEHPLRLSDFVLLFRSMSHVAIYENALRRHDIDYYLVGGRAFYAQQEIFDLLNLLKTLDNPLDGSALVGVLRSPFCGLSDDALTAIAPHPEGPWAGIFDDRRIDSVPAHDRPHLHRARRHLTKWRADKDSVGVCELLTRAVFESGYDAALQFEPLADRKLANLWKLLDRAREYDRTIVGLAGFVAELDELVVRQPREEQAATRPEDDNVVRLMSIHQAKGLEFPVVIIPDLASRTQTGQGDMVRWHRELGVLVRRPADVDESDDVFFSELPVQLGQVADQLADWQEELRVLYVACTRAEERLILSSSWKDAFTHESPTPIPKGGSNHWTMTLAEQFNLRTGQCLDRDANVGVEVTIDTADERESRPLSSRNETAVWLPKLPRQTSSPAIVSLPALERNQPFTTFHHDSRLPNLLRLIPEPSAEERAFYRAWFDPTIKSAWFDRFRNSNLGKRFFAGAERFVHREFTYDLTPTTLVGCHAAISRSKNDVLVVGFRTGTHRDPIPGLALSAWIVSQTEPNTPVQAELFDVETGLSVSITITDQSLERAKVTIRQWIDESLGIEVD